MVGKGQGANWGVLAMGQMGFYFDMTRCTGCRCCQVACKDVNNLEPGVLFRHVTDYEGGTYPQLWAASLSMGCNHCSTPACVPNCPVAAITKDDDTGLVVQDRSMCIGCERCIDFCPYSAPAYIPDDKVTGKCDGCIDLVRAGSVPSCVAACSTRALRFGDLSTLQQTYGAGQNLTSDLTVIANSGETGPSILINPVAGLRAS
jgi:anaerobic dimethyl sulfoxide reductase subunit B (iron-sulfur subunit)